MQKAVSWRGRAITLAFIFAFFGAANGAASFAQDLEQTDVAQEDVAQEDVIDTDVTEETATTDDVENASDAVAELEEEATAEDALEESAPVKRDWGRLQPAVDMVEAGGAVIVILALLSILSLMVIVVKMIQFRLLRVGDHRFTAKVSDMLSKGKADEALAFVAGRTGVIARVMETALHGKLKGFNEEAAREETERVAKAKLDGLERGLPLLSLVATISPLLGLLGTVLGMIEAFQQLENAGDRVDPAILSGGIWEALLTTAAGLTVAIPAAAFFTWLQRSVDVAAQHMEDAAVRVFTSSLYEEGASDTASELDDA